MDHFVLLLILIIGGITGVVLYQIFLSDAQVSSASCMPKDLSQVRLEFPVKTPSVLPDGYSLQGIEILKQLPDRVYLIYLDHSACISPFHIFKDSQLTVSVQKVSNTEGHAIFSPNGTITEENVTKLPPMTSLEFQHAVLKSVNDAHSNVFLTWKTIDINSYKGLTIESHQTNESDVMFLNDKDQTIYGVGGNLSLNQLLTVAKSIQQ